MKLSMRRTQFWALVVLAASFAAWGTSIILKLSDGRRDAQNLTELMEAVGDLKSRALFDLTRPGNDSLEHWDADRESRNLRLAEAGLQASREALDQILSERNAATVNLDDFDRDTAEMTAAARRVIELAAVRNNRLRDRESPAAIRETETQAYAALAQMNQSFRRAYKSLAGIEDQFRQEQYRLFAARQRLLQQLYVILVVAVAASAACLLLLRQNRRQRRSLMESEQRYRQLIENTSDIIYVADAAGLFCFVNPPAARLTGFAPAELLGRHYTDLVAPEAHHWVIQHYQRQRRERIPNTYLEFPICTKSGDRRWVGQTVDMRAEGGRVVGFQAVVRDITERKQAEEFAQHERARLAALIRGNPLAIVSLDAENYVVDCNPAFESLFGFSAAEVLGKKLDELVVPLEEREQANQLSERVRAGEILKIERVRRHQSGRPIEVQIQAVPIRDAGGNAGVFVLYEDITERKNAESALRRSEERLRDLFDNASDLIQQVAPDGSFQMVNAAWRQTLGYTEEEVARLTMDDVVHPEAKARWRHRFARMLEGESFDRIETRFVTREGRELQVEGSVSPRVVEGRVVTTRGIFRDVTERRKSERRLRIQAAALESAANAIVITRADGTIQWVNSAFTRLTGYTAAEAVGGNLRILSSGCHDSAFSKQMWECILSARVWRGEIINRRKNGELYTEEMTITPVPDDQGAITQFIAIKEDISDRKRAEAEIQRARGAAEKAAQLKSEFLANMSHEIRTPMNGILGMTDLLLDTPLDDTQFDYARSVKECAESLLALLNDILDFSKIEAGKLDLECTDFDVRRVVEGAVEMFAPRAAAKTLELLAQIDADVPPVLRGDPVRLRQVLINLVGNAVKFTEHGEIVLNVTAGPAGELECPVRFAVSDSGIGIPVEKQSIIFEKFSQADGSTTRRYGGTGLGLSISSQLVALMGGRIEVASEPRKGSTFAFTLNLPRGTAPLDEPSSWDALRGLRVLVVDDNATSRTVLLRTLSARGCMVAEAEQATQAIRHLQDAIDNRAPFNLALIDGQMPDVDGATLGRMIKSDPQLRSTHILMLTSMALRGEAAQMKEVGFSAFLVKPVRQGLLFNAILRSIQSGGAELPAKPGDEPSVVITERRAPSARILLAEDNEVNRRIAVAMLERAGYVVAIASNGREAVVATMADNPDLVLMDVQMPELDGLEATRQIRQAESGSERHVPIIALTAHTMKGDRERCLAAGMDDYLPKPLRSQDVLAAVSRWLRSEPPANEPPPIAEYTGFPATPVDLTTLRTVCWGNTDFLKELVETYDADAAMLLPSLRDAIAAGNSQEVERAAHRLRGTSATLGASSLATLLEELERMGREGALMEAPRLLAEVDREYGHVRECLHSCQL